MLRSFALSIFYTSVFLTAFYGAPYAWAQVMQSGSYQIQSDSINIGGGFSTSTNYIQESTVGEIATGVGTSTNFNLNAGYQQMQEVYLSLNSVPDVTMSPSIGGVSGGEANGSTTFTVITDSSGGYQLTLEAELDPAMQGLSGSIANYEPAGAVPDYTFDYTTSEAFFGFSPEGDHVTQRFLDNGTNACGVGSNETSDRCWDEASTTAVAVASDSSANHPNGSTTTIKFRVGVGATAVPLAGVYYATTTVTALAL